MPRSDEVKDRRAGVLPPASLSCLLHGAIARFGTVEEIAHTALFLAAPESGFITGITLSVDGGAVAAGAYMVEKYRRRKAGFAAPPPPKGKRARPRAPCISRPSTVQDDDTTLVGRDNRGADFFPLSCVE